MQMYVKRRRVRNNPLVYFSNNSKPFILFFFIFALVGNARVQR